MKKKFVALFIASILACSCFPGAMAETSTPTIRRPLTEFCELYIKRIMEFNSQYSKNMGGLNADLNGVYMTHSYKDTYGISCSGGSLIVDKEDLSIEYVSQIIMDLDADEQEGYNVILNALIVISALEMDDRDAWMIEEMHKIDDSKPENVIMKYLDVYSNTIHPAISSNVDGLNSGEEVLVYQGNYDYYVNYTDDEEIGEYIMLSAQARE